MVVLKAEFLMLYRIRDNKIQNNSSTLRHACYLKQNST